MIPRCDTYSGVNIKLVVKAYFYVYTAGGFTPTHDTQTRGRSQKAGTELTRHTSRASCQQKRDQGLERIHRFINKLTSDQKQILTFRKQRRERPG